MNKTESERGWRLVMIGFVLVDELTQEILDPLLGDEEANRMVG